MTDVDASSRFTSDQVTPAGQTSADKKVLRYDSISDDDDDEEDECRVCRGPSEDG
jgi:hypothetical protein